MAYLLPSNASPQERIVASHKLLFLAGAVKPGETAKALPKGVTGRRTLAQETAYATARQRWSRALKLAGIGPSDKRGSKTPAKRAPQASKANAKSDTPMMEPIKGAKAMDRNAALAHITLQMANLLKFADAFNASHKATTLPVAVTGDLAECKAKIESAAANK